MMSEGTPSEEGTAHPATSLGAAGVAAHVDGGDNGSAPNAEVDEYDRLLAKIGRTYDQDCRVAIHEAGHIVAARLQGHPLGGATVDPGSGFEGRVWGEGHEEAFAEGRGDVSDVREALAPLMPEPGEAVSPVSDVFANVQSHCIELVAGRAAERMLLGDDDTPSAADDLRQARELALLICKSEEAMACEIAARDLLLPYGDLMMVLSTVLRIKRTLDAAEIDEIILDVETQTALAMEHRRRAEWRKSELEAARFRAECEPFAAARLRTCSHDQVS